MTVPESELGPVSRTRDEIKRASIPPRSPELVVQSPMPGFVLPSDENGSIFRTMSAVIAAFPRLEPGGVVVRIVQDGLRSLGFVALVLAFVSSILVYQAGIQASRVVPDMSTIGPSYLEILARDLAATLAALMLATRVGAGIAAEIGGMRVTDQLDALRLSGADPVVTLVLPRILASLIYTPFITLIGAAVAVVSGTATGYFAFEINPGTFLDLRFIDEVDIAMGLSKSVIFGLAVPLVSAHAGLYAEGGSRGVGDATTRAVVRSSLSVIILGFIIGALVELLGGS